MAHTGMLIRTRVLSLSMVKRDQNIWVYLFIYIYINIRKKIEIFPENCYGNESNYCIWSTKSIQEKIFVCM